MLTLTQNCNLNCTYCYEHFKTNKRMNFDVAINALKKQMQESDKFDEYIIEFNGGEPFLEFDLLRKICEYTWNNSWPKPYLFFATTNGTLIHKDIKSWLAKNKDKIHIALSLDGTEEMHNMNRSNSFSNIEIDFFKNSWPEQPIKMTISKETLPKLSEGIFYIHSLGFNIENNLAYGVDWSDRSNYDILFRELRILADYYLNNSEIVPCELFSMEIKQVALKKHKAKKWCGAGTSMVAIDTDGKEYPCHFFLPISIDDDKASLSNEIDFSKQSNIFDPKCKDCILLPICPTCYGVNYEENNNPAIRNRDLCNLNKIRALACSYLRAQQILKSKEQKIHLNEQEIMERNLLIDSIKKIQNSIKVSGR